MLSTRFSPMTARPIRPMSAVAVVITEAPASEAAASRPPGTPHIRKVRTSAKALGHVDSGKAAGQDGAPAGGTGERLRTEHDPLRPRAQRLDGLMVHALLLQDRDDRLADVVAEDFGLFPPPVRTAVVG